MITLSTSATTKLERYARKQGLKDFGIVKSPDNAAGVYFCVRLDGKLLSRWYSLGWTVQEAKERIVLLACGRGQEINR